MTEQREIQPLRILLVDDDRHDRTVFRRAFLQSHDPAEITECVRAEEALELLRTEPLRFDLVVSDYKLPGLSGLDFYRAVDSEERSFAVVLLTGAGTERLAVEALHAGVDDYLIKDTHQGYVELLPTVLREVVRWREDRAARKRAEEALRKAHEELERRVRERTAELQRTNTVLRTEITARKKVEEVLQTLSRRLLEAQETERRHLASELHDEIGQALTVLKINLQEMERDPRESALRLSDSLDILSNTLQQVRNLSLDLRPSVLDDLGLVIALDWYLKRQAQRVGLVPHFEADHIEPRPSAVIETTCFRIVQEALTNIARHARAQNVWVEVRQHDTTIAVRVRDDGSGFDVRTAHAHAAGGMSLGLVGMEERARLAGGEIEIVSQLGEGTEIRATLPRSERTGDSDLALVVHTLIHNGEQEQKIHSPRTRRKT
jgi:signal transduction histidine kinase